jgi:hypothetical protein
MVRPGGQPGSTAAMTSAEHLTSAEGGLVVVHEGQGFSLWSVAIDDNEPCSVAEPNA